MKTMILLTAAILVSGIAFASEGIRLSLTPAEEECATIEIRNGSRNEIAIDVTDEWGNTVFEKTVPQPVDYYQRKYDFSGLNEGNYVLRAQTGNELNETLFEIAGGKVIFKGERKVTEPYVTMTDNTWKISYLNHPLESLNLYVYEGSRLLHHERIEPAFAVHKGLDLSELVPGNYKIIFANKYNSYGYSVAIK